jgi:hypothetical protein
VLVALLENPGQVVTREELREKLWSQDTFVDFEHGLNKAINRVVPSGKVEEFVSLKGLQFTGFYTFWFGLGPDDSPLLLKDTPEPRKLFP